MARPKHQDRAGAGDTIGILAPASAPNVEKKRASSPFNPGES